MLDGVNVESIERATLAAVPPDHLEALPGWLLPLDRGTVGRARSAVPLHHGAQDAALLPRIEAVYADHGLPTTLRLPIETPGFESLTEALRDRGYVPSRPTQVMHADPRTVAAAARPDAVQVSTTPGEDWARVYLGEGFDPVDGQSRVRLLRRAKDAIYASLRLAQDLPGGEAGDVAAVGSGCFAEGWMGVHGMRTRPRFRGHGFARQLMAAMGAEAVARGVERTFLQVEAENYLARSLYARVGFVPAWIYVYWQRPGADALLK
ncbi:GNAT family N-acetyltransferase [uncultured Pseudacidovorax sp.]|uniref:GNAT family N-acetyltransferase n=1 Tax=uncultured Pseudacidovorax sp. TaxID=679313 RepID=UPI0025F2EA01|nr:GNAT family N-acetyltransferase [uncultured Pseudacidovorax sp.]